ncbi:MAG: spore photoproduct lyase family protein [Candidatus Omnitrophota bacterium]
MQTHKKELRRLNSARESTTSFYPHFGKNKKQEIIRLLYEISKREGGSPLNIIQGASRLISNKSSPRIFPILKKHLLKLRYPYSFSENTPPRAYLPKLDLKDSWVCSLQEKAFYPKNILIEKKASDSYLIGRLKQHFPKAKFSQIQSFKKYRHSQQGDAIKSYNKRRDTLFVINELFDFFKKCPCTKGANGCGYHIFNLGFGCIFECSYCYLQRYTNSPGIIIPANINTFFDRLASYKRSRMHIGTGEFLDSLALDNITGFSVEIAEFFKNHTAMTFEFKTKSANIGNLLKIKPARNIVISWSLNPRRIIKENEFFTPGLEQRLKAAQKCAKAGYRIGFHFDPVVYYPQWHNEYNALIELLFDHLNPKDIAWMSIGTFRFKPGLKQVIERRFPENKILNQEMVLGFDNKLRYPHTIRYEIYLKMLDMLRQHNKKLKLYLCMEEALIWKKLKLKLPNLT